MFKFLAPLVLALGLAVGLAGSSLTSASNPPAPQVGVLQPNPDLFQYQGQSLQAYSTDNAALKQTGQWVWRFVDVKGCTSESIRQTVTDGINEAATAYGINIVERDDLVSSHAVYGNCGSTFASICGGPPVIGCLGRGFPYVNDVDISTDMAAYYDVSQRSIAMHEVIGHAMAVWNEQYLLDGTFGNSQDVTIMNTGPNSRHDIVDGNGVPAPAEANRWWRTMGSPELTTTGYANNGAWYTYACGFDANATRVSVLVNRHDGKGLVWAGTIKQLVADKNGCMGIGPVDGLNITAGYAYYLKQENPSSWKVSLNETCVKGGTC